MRDASLTRRRTARLAGPAAFAKQPVAATRANASAKGMVSSADPRASEAGAEILRQGGSAVDAAFATLLALNVVEPESQGIGGGSYLVYSAKGATPVTFDGREIAPRAATGTWFYKDGNPMEHGDAVPGGKSVGVPGNLRMMAMAQRAMASCLGRPFSSLRSSLPGTDSRFRRGSTGARRQPPHGRPVAARPRDLLSGRRQSQAGRDLGQKPRLRRLPRRHRQERSGSFLCRSERAEDRRHSKPGAGQSRRK